MPGLLPDDCLCHNGPSGLDNRHDVERTVAQPEQAPG